MNTELQTNDIYNINTSFNIDWLDRFIKFVDVNKSTISSYKSSLKQFFKWVKENDVFNPKQSDILNYRDYLKSLDLKADTKQQYMRAVRQLFRWLQAENLYKNVADNIKLKGGNKKSKRESLSRTSTAKVLNNINTESEKGKRNYAMVLLSVTTGCRNIEINRANVGDIALYDNSPILYIQGKGHEEKDDYVKLTPLVYKAINNYLAERKEVKQSSPLFASLCNRTKGNRIHKTRISTIIKSELIAAGYDSPRITAHSLRHTSITLLLELGTGLQEAKMHARHSKIDTTMIYAHNLKKRSQNTEEKICDYICEVM